jgi:hypothetical protein
MSLVRPVNLVCPSCGHLIVMEAVGSVNADRRPDLREDILQDRFQDVHCGACGKSFRLQPEFNYLDVGRGQWIAGMPAARMPAHLQVEDEVTAAFDQFYGAQAPAAAREVGEGLTVRLTFGWPALREKLLLRGARLDDVLVEMMKLDLLRHLPSAPLGPGTELRLVRATDDLLAFVWIETATEKGLQEVVLPRAAYDEMVAGAEAWAGIRAQLTNGPFVDIQKLYMGLGRGATPPPEPVIELEPADGP